MSSTVSIQYFTHYEVTVFALRIGNDIYWFQQTVARTTRGLLRARSIEAPHWAIFELAAEIVFNFGFATKALSGIIPVKPNVLKLCCCHTIRIVF
jgi:hypothetical protein